MPGVGYWGEVSQLMELQGLISTLLFCFSDAVFLFNVRDVSGCRRCSLDHDDRAINALAIVLKV